MITAAALSQIAKAPVAIVEPFVQPLNLACSEFGIQEGPELAAFVAQCAHESAGFSHLEENLNYSTPDRIGLVFGSSFSSQGECLPYVHNPAALANRVYANRNGNGDEASGDGWRYRGRGLIQISGRSNYLACLRDLYGAEDADPDRLLDVDGAARSAAWYWFRNHCGIPAARGNIDAVTRIINGSAMAGKQDRRDLFARAMSLLCPSAPSTT